MILSYILVPYKIRNNTQLLLVDRDLSVYLLYTILSTRDTYLNSCWSFNEAFNKSIEGQNSKENEKSEWGRTSSTLFSGQVSCRRVNCMERELSGFLDKKGALPTEKHRFKAEKDLNKTNILTSRHKIAIDN